MSKLIEILLDILILTLKYELTLILVTLNIELESQIIVS